MQLFNINPEHFLTHDGKQVLAVDGDGFPSISAEMVSNDEIALANIALTIYTNCSPLHASSVNVYTVTEWVRQFKSFDGEQYDNEAIDHFADVMKAKMAKNRLRGRSGWSDKEQCPNGRLQAMLVDHVNKGDPVDVGIFAMMLFARSEPTTFI